MNTLGCRLREERERLGLTQAEFGEIGGVKKLAQFHYEKDVRKPNAIYFDNLRGDVSVDVGYILSGYRDNNERKLTMSYVLVESCITTALEIHENSFSHAIDTSKHFEVVDHLDTDMMDDISEIALKAVEESVAAAIEKSPKVINFKILEDVITQLECLLIELNLTMTPQQKATAITMLYRTSKLAGKIDKKLIEDTIKLAAR